MSTVYDDTSIILIFCFMVAVWSVFFVLNVNSIYKFILSSCVHVHIRSILYICFYPNENKKSWIKTSFLISCSIFLQLFLSLRIPSSCKCKDIHLSLLMNLFSLYIFLSMHIYSTSFILINCSSQKYLRFLPNCPYTSRRPVTLLGGFPCTACKKQSPFFSLWKW